VCVFEGRSDANPVLPAPRRFVVPTYLVCRENKVAGRCKDVYWELGVGRMG
jgi:hypothetical protein